MANRDFVVADDGALSTASLLALGPGYIVGGSQRAAPPRVVVPKRRKGPFPTSAASCSFSVQHSVEKPSCHTRVHRHMLRSGSPLCSRVFPHPWTAAAPCVSSQVTPATGTRPALQTWGHEHTPCPYPWAPVRGHLVTPTPPISLSLSACFLGFCLSFSRQKQPPSLHLPSLSTSQLFLVLFSASYYLELKIIRNLQPSTLNLAKRSTPALCCVSKSLHGSPWVFLSSPQVLSPGAQHRDACLAAINCEMLRAGHVRGVKSAIWARGSGTVCDPRSPSPQDVMGFWFSVLSSHVFSPSLW